MRPSTARRSLLAVVPAIALSYVLAAGCVVHKRPPPVTPGGAPAPVVEADILPFYAVLDAGLRDGDPVLFRKLSAFDAGGNGDGIFTRGDAWLSDAPTSHGPQLFADLHVHPFMNEALRPFFRGGLDSRKVAKSPTTILATQLNIPALKLGATNVLFASVYVDAFHMTARGRLREALHQLEYARGFAREHRADVEIALTSADVRRIVASKKIAIVLCVEGGHAISRVGDLDRLWEDGVRMMTITHFTTNDIGGAAFSTVKHPENFHFFGYHSRDTDGTVRTSRGLTPFGRAVVTRMAELGMIIDLAHASDATVKDVLDATADHPVPLVISHTAMRAYHASERNESDALVKAVADRGGVIGISVWRLELDAADIDECHAFSTHFRRLLDLVGPDHVGIGTDFNGLVIRPRPCAKGGAGIRGTGLRNVGDTPALYQELVDDGVPGSVLEGMGANILRVMDEAQRAAIVPAATGPATAKARSGTTDRP